MRRLSFAYLFAAFPLLLPISHFEAARAQEPGLETLMAQAKQAVPDAKAAAATEDRSRRAECSWLGQRVISLLWRDDVNTAREQTRFYEMFGCPTEHLSIAFRCVIEQSQSQPDQNDLNARAYSCWMSPSTGQTQE